MRPRLLLVAGVSAALGSVCAAAPAHAQTTSTNGNVAAEALFEDGRALVAAGKYAEACPKFADSQRLGPSVATLLNLANCWEKLGRTASAWATYRQAASDANAAGRKDYLTTALRRADGLAPKLARLTVTVAQPVNGLVIKRDGVPVDSAELGSGIPVDTGMHAVEASAPGHKPWSVTVDVAQDGALASVSVPALEEAPDATPAPTPAAVSPSSSPSPLVSATSPDGQERDTASRSAGSGQRVAGAVVAGVGVAGLIAGGVFAILAKSDDTSSRNDCESTDPNMCSQAGVNQRNDARTFGDVATVSLIAGGAAVVAGAVVWFTAPHARPSTGLEVLPTLGGVVARGAW